MSLLCRALTALLLTATTCLATTQPASAASGVTVNVSAGKLTITGSPAADDIQINQIASGLYAVWVTPTTGPPEIHNVSGVTGDIVIDLGDGDDHIRIGNLAPIALADSLHIKPANGQNSIDVTSATVADDIVVNGEAAVVITDSTIGDDLLGTSGDASLSIRLTNSRVGDLANLRATRSGRVQTSLNGSSVRRIRVTGGRASDHVRSTTSDLGLNPRFDLRDGGDGVVLVGDSEWTGALTYQGGNGNDQFFTRDEVTIGVPIAANRMSKVIAQMGNGDDLVGIEVPLTTSGSVVNGQGGLDTLTGPGFNHPTSAADYRLFEDVDTPAEEKVVIDSTGGDLNITVNGVIAGLRVDSSGDGYRVGIRDTETLDEEEQFVAAIDGDVSITVHHDLFVQVGSKTQTAVSASLNLVAADQAQVGFQVVDAIIDGNLSLTTDGYRARLNLSDSYVAGRLDGRATGNGSLALTIDDTSLGRFRANGANQADTFFFTDVDLGTAPVFTLRGGQDIVNLTDTRWAGRLQLNAGSGDDSFTTAGADPLARTRILLGAGDDEANIHGIGNRGSGSQFQGDAGDDILLFPAAADRAVLRTFETVTFFS